MKIQTVTVIGANGTMGCNVSGIFASFGDAKVYMVSRNVDDSKKALLKSIKSVRADSIQKNLIPVDYSSIKDCVAESDLIFEIVREDFNVKQSVLTEVCKYARTGTIICSGTSGLSITKLAEVLSVKLRPYFFGVHMFNPPYNLNLCELISTKYSDATVKLDLLEYLNKTLHRTVAEVKDYPAFLANRIGFQFISEALQYAEIYKDSGGIDYIDAILGPFTGRTMAPLVTADFVGLDVTKAIVNNVHDNTNDFAKDTFVLPKFVEFLITQNKLGRKSGEGLYKTIKHEDGTKKKMVYDISTADFREKIDYVFPFAERMIDCFKKGSYRSGFEALIANKSVEASICLKFLLKYIVYALCASEEVGYTVRLADDVMANGFNWCPPLALRDAFCSVADFNQLLREHLGLSESEIEHLNKISTESKYDYRIYFKARR